MSSRPAAIVGRAWTYFTAALARPADLPHLALGAIRQAHLGESLKLAPHRRLLQRAGIQTVIDVGAHAGEFLSALAVILPTARLYAFEPLTDRCRRLRHRFRAHRDFHAFAVALGAEAAESTLHRSSFSKASSLLPMARLHAECFPWSAATHPTPVTVHTLDQYLGELDLESEVLLKIDVQGAEDRVLAGARRALDAIRFVLVEISLAELYEGQACFADLFDRLRGAGFEYRGCWDQLASPSDGSILQVDAFFARPG